MFPVPHPAKAVLAMRRITNRRVARTLGKSEHYVGRCLNGRDKPSAEFRRALAALLDLPESELFREDDRQMRGAA